MSDHLHKSIQELEGKLKLQEADANKTKQAINSLYEMLDEEPPHIIGGVETAKYPSLKPDTFFGIGLATAVGDYLTMRGNAVPVAEIMAGLQKGGYDFGGAKYPERVLRINLGKNVAKFVQIKGSDSFGLKKWYPNLRPAGKTKNEVDANEAEVVESSREIPEIEEVESVEEAQ